MSRVIKIKKGLNIKLEGEAVKTIGIAPSQGTFAIKPTNFTGLIPKLLVKEGEEIMAGSALFYDKNNEDIRFCSPVSGEVVEIVRGEKRKILEIKILADKEIKYLDLQKSNPSALSRETILTTLLKGGAWPFIRQRPFGTIANPVDIPKSVFISAFDTSPLAPDYNFIMQGHDEEFQAGLDALQKLTHGKVHLNVQADADTSPVFMNATGVEINKISGPHPAGNVGVQIHHIDPVNKGELVWCVSVQDVQIIGRLFIHGRFDAYRIIALAGSQVKQPKYFKTHIGCNIKNILDEGGLKEGENRIISGNVLTGHQILYEGYLDFYDAQVTVIPEGKQDEFMGWLAPGFGKYSLSRTFFSWLTPNKKFTLDSNMHGEERPFVVTGQYEKVFPMDIYPVELLKSILIEDIELMENLGIYEVVEEDFALCEFVCTSKIESQDIIRRGLEIMRKEFA
ncbi:Na(+)-translocating NADH-quinone reductase subunit A [soil metagenome]